MKRLALAAVLAVLSIASAKADVVDYAELFGGVTFAPDQDVNGVSYDLDTGYNVGGAFGWNLSPAFALEADFLFTSSDYDLAPPADGGLDTFSFMANAVWNIDAGGGFRPYLGAGAGGIQLNFTDGVSSGGAPYIGDSDIVFGWQGFAGFAVNVDNNIDFIAEYRYQGAEDGEGAVTNLLGVSSPLVFEYSSHNVMAGFRFNIP
jgi:opacity protein-like surface antigen